MASGKRNDDYTQEELDNHSNQMNPNNDAYWEARGEDERPEDWKDQIEEEEKK